MSKKSKTEQYTEYINGHILPFIDYSALDTSYNTDMVYAKGILNRLHNEMVRIYGGERLEAEYDGNDSVLIPGIVRGQESGKMCVALLELDLSSSGEHWDTEFLCKYGVIPQDGDGNTTIFIIKELDKSFIPYDYGYTATIPDDIHVERSRLPQEIKDILSDFRNHTVELLFEENGDEYDNDSDEDYGQEL